MGINSSALGVLVAGSLGALPACGAFLAGTEFGATSWEFWVTLTMLSGMGIAAFFAARDMAQRLPFATFALSLGASNATFAMFASSFNPPAAIICWLLSCVLAGLALTAMGTRRAGVPMRRLADKSRTSDGAANPVPEPPPFNPSFRTNDGGTLRLGRVLGRGGEGAVYEVEGQPGLCAKIYTAKSVNVKLHDKLRVMVANPPEDPTIANPPRGPNGVPFYHNSIAWPTRVLYRGTADASHFAGFVMPTITDSAFRKAICFFHPGDRQKYSAGEFTWEHAYNTARNIASAVAAVHERGHCIGDINESNILVAGTTLATLIDCDSFQIQDRRAGNVFRCPVGKGEYTAPELAGKVYSDVDRTPSTDHFGLAVLLFQFLMEGCHPYQARGPLVEDAPSTEKKISLGHFPYRLNGKPPGVEPPLYAPPFNILPPDIQKLFERAFADGHREPSARPTSREWFDTLRRLRDQIVACPANPRHRYFNRLPLCPWCQLRLRKGKDPFPAPL